MKKLRENDRSSSSRKGLSSSRGKSLSPECQRITDRLYTSRINKQPCLRYLKHQELDRKAQIEKILK